jgi:hypothetical protein
LTAERDRSLPPDFIKLLQSIGLADQNAPWRVHCWTNSDTGFIRSRV